MFSVSPSEMCDERTASRLSTFNSAKRNGLSTENLVNMAQLHDHWTYGLESPTYTHTASLILPKSKASASKTICLPTPTLQDLLNPAAPNEEPSFLVTTLTIRSSLMMTVTLSQSWRILRYRLLPAHPTLSGSRLMRS